MQTEAQYKNRLLPALVRLGFDDWEEIFGTRKDDILVHRVAGDTMSPFIPRGSIVLVDTTKRHPVTGELYLVGCHPEWIPEIKRAEWRHRPGKSWLELKSHYIPYGCKERDVTWKYSPEEIKMGNKIIGRVIGVVAMYHQL